MAPGGGWDAAVAMNLEAGFITTPLSAPRACLLYLGSKDGISAEEFQEFIDNQMA